MKIQKKKVTSGTLLGRRIVQSLSQLAVWNGYVVGDMVVERLEPGKASPALEGLYILAKGCRL